MFRVRSRVEAHTEEFLAKHKFPQVKPTYTSHTCMLGSVANRAKVYTGQDVSSLYIILFPVGSGEKWHHFHSRRGAKKKKKKKRLWQWYIFLQPWCKVISPFLLHAVWPWSGFCFFGNQTFLPVNWSLCILFIPQQCIPFFSVTEMPRLSRFKLRIAELLCNPTAILRNVVSSCNSDRNCLLHFWRMDNWTAHQLVRTFIFFPSHFCILAVLLSFLLLYYILVFNGTAQSKG